MEAFEDGIGKLFTDPDPDNARAFFRTKSREMKSKVMSVKEAVEKFTKDGEYFVTGGFGANRIPTAVVHEMLRQGRYIGHDAAHGCLQIIDGGRIWTATGENARARRSANRLLTVGALEEQALVGQAVDIGRLDPFLSVAP